MITDSLGRQWHDNAFNRGHAEGYYTTTRDQSILKQSADIATETLSQLSHTASQLGQSITEVADTFAKFSFNPTPVDIDTIDTLNEIQEYIEEQNDNLYILEPTTTTAPLKINNDNSILINANRKDTINLNAHIILRNDTIENWLDNNPILLQGELAVVVDKFFDTVKLKIGDGERHFVDLPYVTM